MNLGSCDITKRRCLRGAVACCDICRQRFNNAPVCAYITTAWNPDACRAYATRQRCKWGYCEVLLCATWVLWYTGTETGRGPVNPVLQCSVSSMELSCTGACRVECPVLYQVVPVAVGCVEGWCLECASMDTPLESRSLRPSGEGVQGTGISHRGKQEHTRLAGPAGPPSFRIPWQESCLPRPAPPLSLAQSRLV